MDACAPRRCQPDVRFHQHLPGELAAVTCYFNPCDYCRPKRNYHEFAAGLAGQGVPLFTIELAFGARPFFLPESERVLRLRGADVLWQKSAC